MIIIKILELLVESKQSSSKLYKVEIGGVITTAKECGKCGEIKTLDKFHKNKPMIGGVHSNCKECRSERKIPKREIIKINIDGIEVDAKDCTRCGEVKPLTEFSKGQGVGGRQTKCKDCQLRYRDENREHIKAVNRQYAINNPEKVKIMKMNFRKNNPNYYRDYYKEWRPNNRDKQHKYYINYKPKHKIKMKKWNEENKKYHYFLNKVNGIKRRAIDNYLVGDCTANEILDIKEYFDGSCALSDEIENIQIDHFIPISWGHGGTYVGNLIPLSEPLNRSKFNKNPFEWIKQDDIKHLINKEKWDNTIKYLADSNNMSVDEYKQFVYYCDINRRTLEDLEMDNTSSIDLWNSEKVKYE